MKTCTVPNCNREHAGRGYCLAHWLRWKRHGQVFPEKPITKSHPGSQNPRWKGGQINDGHGRVLIYAPGHPFPNWCGTHVYRYRLVAERSIGRHLLPEEIVHHKNGIKDDDRPENLEVMNQSEHAKTHNINGRFQ